MFGYMSKKDRKIKNLEAMVKNRDKKIIELELQVEFLKENLTPLKRQKLGL